MEVQDRSKLSDEVGRPILSQQKMTLVGRMAWFVRGVLTLTGERLSFRPTGTIDRLAGAQDLEFSIDEIEATGGAGKELFIVIGGKKSEFRGRGAGDILEQLARLGVPPARLYPGAGVEGHGDSHKRDFFHSFTAANFLKDESGNDLFYPWGVLGSGFVIDSEAKTREIQRRYRQVRVRGTFAIIFFQGCFSLVGGLAALLVYCLVFPITVSKIIEGLPPSTIKLRLSFSEYYKAAARAHSLASLQSGVLGSLGLVAMGIFLSWIRLYEGDGFEFDNYLGFYCMAFFGWAAIVEGYMLKVKDN